MTFLDAVILAAFIVLIVMVCLAAIDTVKVKH